MNGFRALAETLGDGGSAVASATGRGIAVAVIGLLLVVSGGLKLRRPIVAAFAIHDFGVGSRVRRWAGLSLGACELIVGLAVVASTAVAGLRPAVVVAALLFWTFSILIARSLSRGERFDCACFGDASAAISARTQVRAVGLAIAATALSMAPASVVPARTAILYAIIAAAACAVATLLRLAVLVAGMKAQVVRPLREATS